MPNTISVQEIESAIGDHEIWKRRLRDTLRSGQSEIPATTASRYDLCKFGQWLDRAIEGVSPEARLPYEVVNELHIRFHHNIASVIASIERGNMQAAQDIMEDSCDYVMEELVGLLHDWRREIKARDTGTTHFFDDDLI